MISSLMFLALASQGITFGATYDCGPGYARFRVASCSAGVCTVDYANPGAQTRRIRMYQSQITTAIGRGCHTGKTAQDYRNDAARYEAQANALLAGSKRANVPARVAVVPHNRAPAAGGGALVLGKYECYTLSGGELESAMADNFTLYRGGRFIDYTGHPGSYSYSGGVVTFSGTGLGGHRAKYAPGVPHSNNPPHISFLNANGEEYDSCDGQG